MECKPGAEYRPGDTLTCANPECQKSFRLDADIDVQDQNAPKDVFRNENKGAQQEGPRSGFSAEEAKSLAQEYFSDLISDMPQAEEQHSFPVSSEPDVLTAEEELQKQKLLELAQQQTKKEQEEHREKQTRRRTQPVRFIREKQNQPRGFWILAALLCIIPVVRIILTRISASLEQFGQMQVQAVPSFLYFLAAMFLLFHLLRRTEKPEWAAAVLLLLPLVTDFWYLIPAMSSSAHWNLWMTVFGAIKIVICILGLVFSLKAKKHPALRYKESAIGIKEADKDD